LAAELKVFPPKAAEAVDELDDPGSVTARNVAGGEAIR
jgi:Mn-dependent DtxR family transcriptional regulator